MAMGNWLHQVIGKGSKGTAAKPEAGMRMKTADDVVLGTIDRIWHGTDARDHAPHPDTLGVRQLEADAPDLLYVPADLVDRVSAGEVVLRVDATQVKNRGCRFRPEWLAPDAVAAH